MYVKKKHFYNWLVGGTTVTFCTRGLNRPGPLFKVESDTPWAPFV